MPFSFRLLPLITCLAAGPMARAAPPPLSLLHRAPGPPSPQTSSPPTQANAPVQLKKFGVKADRHKSLTIPSLDEARADLARVPGGAETIDAHRFTRGRASTVNDIFALSAGVIAQSRFGSDEARLSIRGSGLQRTFHGRGIRVLQDGVPLNLADGSFDMQAFEPLAASYVNVWRGANALAYGASTLGGAIEFVSHTGRGGADLLRLEAGSFGYLRALAAGGAVHGDTDIHAAFTRSEQEGFRAHARQKNARLFSNAGWRLNDRTETRVYLTAVTTGSELPGSLFKSEVSATPRMANPASVAQNHKRDFDLLRIATKTTLRLGDTVWDASVAWTYKDLDHPISVVIDQLSNDRLAAVTVTHAGDLARRANRLKAGFMWTHNDVNAATFVNSGGARGALLADANQRATNTELWIEDQFTPGAGVTLIAGSTFAWNRRVNDQKFGGSGSSTRTYRNASPKLGVRWDANFGQIYGNVSGSFEPPSFSETDALAAPNRAQRASTAEIGTRGARSALRWDVSIYSAQLRDEFLSLNDEHGNPLGTINAPRTTHAGIEFAGEADLFEAAQAFRLARDHAGQPPSHRLMLRAAWTYGRFRFDGHPVHGDNPLAGFAPHLVRGELIWEAARGWYAGPNFEWAPRRAPLDFAHTLFADAYSIFGFRIGRRVARGVSWFAEIRNAFDRHHAATTGVIPDAGGLDTRQFLPGETRAFYGGVEYTW